MKLGRVTQVSPLRVKINGETADAPANGPRGIVLALNDEVLVATAEGRRFVVWA